MEYLIDGALIITMDPQARIVKDGAIFIEDGIIRAVGEREVIRRSHATDNVIRAEGMIAMPGLISAHTHIAMSVMRGLASDRKNVIYDVYWPVERALDGEIVGAWALLGGSEALLSGITTVADHYFFMEEIARSLKALGMRGALGHTVMDLEGPWKGGEELRKALAFLEKWRGDPLIRPLVAPHATDTVSQELLKELKAVAEKEGVKLHMHVAQTKREVERVRERGFKSPVKLLDCLGLLDKRLVAVHCIYVDDEDLDLIASKRPDVVLCPSTYMLSGEEVRGYEMVRLGVNVALGLDSPCLNDNLDPFEEMRLFIMCQRQKYKGPVLKAIDALRAMTINAAKALGLESELGSLEAGKRADVILVDYKSLRFAPYLNPIAAVVYSACAGDVRMVMVNGEIVVWERKLVKVNEEEVIKRALKAFDKLSSKLDNKFDISGSSRPLEGGTLK